MYFMNFFLMLKPIYVVFKTLHHILTDNRKNGWLIETMGDPFSSLLKKKQQFQVHRNIYENSQGTKTLKIICNHFI